MSLWPRKKKKRHKVKGNDYITFMIMPDPTKKAKVIKIPKWIRFPIYIGLCVIAVVTFLFTSQMEDLNNQIVMKRKELAASTYIIKYKTDVINELEQTNQQHYDKLESLQSLASELDLKVKDLENYKYELDYMLNNTEKTTDLVPDGYEQLFQESPTIFQDQSTYKKLETFSVNNTSGKDSLEKGLKELNQELEFTLQSVNQDASNYAVLEKQLDYMIPYWDSYPSGYPVKSTYITSGYGWRRDPIYGGSAFHKGIDFAANYVPVYATGNGEVQKAEYDSGYGYVVEINHGYGLVTRYAHNSQLLVENGEVVERGDQIAVSGATGRTTGPHVHYEILRYGQVEDPLDYISEGE